MGTGSADIPVAIAEWAKRAGLEVHITGVDLHETTISLAREFVKAQGFDNIEIVRGDALRLMEMFKPGEFHYAHAGLFLHHLQDIEVITVLRMMDRLTTHGVIWNDLVRGWAGRIGMRMLAMLPGVPAMAKHDGLVSVEAGFTRREAMDLARRAGWTHARYRGGWGYRFVVASEKK